MNNTSPQKTAEELRNERFNRYLNAAGVENAESIYKPSAMERWLKDHALPVEDGLARFLACPTYRMLKLMDSIGAPWDPLGMSRILPPDKIETIGTEWIKHCVEANMAIIEAPWGGEKARPQLSALARRIRKAIEHFTNASARVDHPEEKYEIFAGGYERVPTLGLFPFFLLDERLRSWHVIPFGILRELGLVMKNELAAAVFPDFQARTASSDGAISISTDEVKNIISEVNPNQDYRFLYFGAGHAAYRILLSYLDAEDYRKLRTNLDDLHTVWPKRPEPQHVGSLLSGNKSGNTKYILLSDLGDPLYSRLYEESRETKKWHSLVWFRIQLTQNIPVGVGFSLAAMAKFLRTPELLREVATIMRDTFVGNTKLANDLELDGVRIDETYLAYLNLLARQKETPASIELEANKKEQLAKLREQIRSRLNKIWLAVSYDSARVSTSRKKFEGWKTHVLRSEDVPNLEWILKSLEQLEAEADPFAAEDAIEGFFS